MDTASVPGLLAQSGVISMGKVVEDAKKILAAEQKEMILIFVMAVLLLILGVGVVADTAGFAALKIILNLIGEVGNVPLTIYDLINSKGEGALFALFGFLVGGLGSRMNFKDAAVARRSSTKKDMDSLTPIREELDKISTVRQACLKNRMVEEIVAIRSEVSV